MTAVTSHRLIVRFIDNRPTFVGTTHPASFYLSPLSNMLLTNQIVVHTFTGSPVHPLLTSFGCVVFSLSSLIVPDNATHAVLVLCP
jgi:hypothetical protein